MRPLEVGVCGCGPGGLAAALLLHRMGHRVRLIERFATPKPLGSGLLLQPTGLAVLAELGLEDEMTARGRPIAGLFGRTVPSGRVVLDVRYAALGQGVAGLAVHRSTLFGVLFEAVTRQGIAIETGSTVTAVDGGSVVTDGGRTLGPFDLVVDALGSRSPLVAATFGAGLRRPLTYGALWATLAWPGEPFRSDLLEQRYRKSSIMVGVLPVGRPEPGGEEQTCFFWSLKPGDYEAWRAEGLDRWRDEVASVWPETRSLVEQVSEPDQLALARYGHHTLSRPFAGRLVMIGDAAHSTSPQLGQGANMALLDALALATALRANREIDAALAAYARLRRLHVRLYQVMSLGFTPFYQSDSAVMPVLRDTLFALATLLPGSSLLLASLVAGRWGRPLARILPARVRHGTFASASP